MRHHHQCGGNYTKLVPEKVWAHFKDCYYKLLRISAHEYPRLRNSTEIVDGLVELVVLCDAAQGMVITVYITHPMTISRTATMIRSKGYLCSDSMTLPRRELAMM